MQSLYAQTVNDLPIGTQTNTLKKNLRNSYLNYLYIFNYIYEVAHYQEIENKRIKGLHIQTNADIISTRLMENKIVKSIGDNDRFFELLKKEQLHRHHDDDLVKKLYKRLNASTEFEHYLVKETINGEDDRKIILYLLNKVMMKEEDFLTNLEFAFPTWIDDEKLIMTFTKKRLSKVKEEKEFKVLLNEKELNWEVLEVFAKELFNKTLENDQVFLELIEPQLKNWDINRLTTIDMLLLKMGLCEMLFFPNIPIKVTLNEYIEISKLYSTPKSKDFINGILDRLMKQLQNEGRLRKSGRGLKE